MGTTRIHDPFFRAVTAREFRREMIADLAAGRCAAIQVPHAFPDARCREIFTALSEVEFASYGTARVYPAVMRFGVGVSDHRQGGIVADSYWAALADSQAAWRGLGLAYDPFAMCREVLGAYWPGRVAVGRRGGREMGAGVAREPNGGFIVHFDDASREFSGNLLDDSLVAQFAFNLYLSVPRKGGETVVWRHQWQPSDEAYRRPNSYGFDDAVVGAAESFELKPEVGSALLFNPRNYHAVLPSEDSRRIALGFSLGLSDTGELLTWG
jgi:L-gamma-glutamyl-L-propargylglycine hydroxylase